MNKYRSHNCNELRKDDLDKNISISGWINKKRDHGNLLFIDLRDNYGITQCIIDKENKNFLDLEKTQLETVIKVSGKVVSRSDETINKEIETGEIEVVINEFEILGTCKELPMPVFSDQEYAEEIRLKYRFLDLRRKKIHENIILRSKVISYIRNEMIKLGFLEFQTPILTSSSPEGARDFLVPSRLNRGKFYALPQAPQQFKQLIMMGGFDKYFQIAPCFRDEDPRSDRSPTDFYQLDIEMSFVNQDDVFDTVKPVIERIFKEYSQKKVESHWPRITYKDSMLWYGTDKPDLRNPIKMKKVCEYFKDAGFAVFSNILKNEGSEIRAIPAPGGGSRNFCDRMNNFAQKEGLPGMGYIFWREADGEIDAAGPLAKNIGFEKSEMIRESLGLKVGDAAFFLGGEPKNFEAFSAKARNQIGAQLKLIDEGVFAFAWIIDFPMYEKDAENDKIDFSHNPFSMPQGGLPALNGNPLEVLGYQYDLACNGYELLSGAIRNHEIATMFKAFELAGYSNAEVSSRFSGMIQGLKFAPPPHGGCALGIDRMLMLLADEENIREVIMFPMNQKGEDLMMNAPSPPTKAQIHELGIRIIEEDVNKVDGS